MDSKPSDKFAITIVEFKPKYVERFREITREWLEEYFEVEPYDRIVLKDPEGQILAHGGSIFFALVGEEVVGTCALIRHAEKKYELAKMGVERDYRGHGVGRKLAQAAIEKARLAHADEIVLATNRTLEAANRLYHSMGFHETRMDEIGPLPYKRRSIVMKLGLTESQ
jgi:GNAT superfamily N-acetyltransferase